MCILQCHCRRGVWLPGGARTNEGEGSEGEVQTSNEFFFPVPWPHLVNQNWEISDDICVFRKLKVIDVENLVFEKVKEMGRFVTHFFTYVIQVPHLSSLFPRKKFSCPGGSCDSSNKRSTPLWLLLHQISADPVFLTIQKHIHSLRFYFRLYLLCSIVIKNTLYIET